MCQSTKSFGLVLLATISLQSNHATAFSVGHASINAGISTSFASHRIQSTESKRCILQMSASDNSDEDSNCNEPHANPRRVSGRKRALLRKYGKAVALSTTLLYGPMASIPSARRAMGSTAHAASTTAAAPADGSAYNFKDFKDIKGKLSLAPGANVEKYEEVLAKVEVEGEAALEDLKSSSKEAALTIGDSGEETETASDSESEVSGSKRAKRAQRKKQKKSAQVSEWESDEFGFGEDDDEDYDSNVLSLGGSSKSSSGNKLGPSKKASKSGDGGGDGSGDVIVMEKMAYNNYKPGLTQEEKIKVIKKGAFYSIFPVFIITTVRGQIKAWKERKWVKKGLAIVEEERQKYLEEKKKKKEGKKDDDDDDDDSGDDDSNHEC
mmetsp:Transcript_37309/g.63499  ORF Transcript_37309/g.63499 Transcript_37309/m.63499 type:complete len:381 (+) Transcript_37309:187-1329(+)